MINWVKAFSSPLLSTESISTFFHSRWRNSSSGGSGPFMLLKPGLHSLVQTQASCSGLHSYSQPFQTACFQKGLTSFRPFKGQADSRSESSSLGAKIRVDESMWLIFTYICFHSLCCFFYFVIIIKNDFESFSKSSLFTLQRQMTWGKIILILFSDLIRLLRLYFLRKLGQWNILHHFWLLNLTCKNRKTLG